MWSAQVGVRKGHQHAQTAAFHPVLITLGCTHGHSLAGLLGTVQTCEPKDAGC